MMLENKIVEEAGPWQEIIAPIFDEIIRNNLSRKGEAEIILDILKRTKSPECYREYRHLYNNILMVVYGNKQLAQMKADSHQDSGTGDCRG
jgi:hypothetical protein